MSESKLIVDGSHATMGRLASYCAKQALLGKVIVIVNCNEVLISGNKESIVDRFKQKIKMGGHGLKGPRIRRSPERILKRAIRGMLSHKQKRGNNALKNIMCYNQTLEEYKEVKKIVAGKKKKGKYYTLKEICSLLK
ncbi:MAG: 50S ribosomal protein L13 [Nanoarchaeota archaeon]|nr:50S ribosomal protein L13 [Nanoarchaeota archaeon]